MATNFLKFCVGSKGGMALASAAGVLGWDCDAGEGRMCIGSALFLGLTVALGSKFMGIG